MLSTLCFLAIATIFDYLPSSDVLKHFKYVPICLISPWLFYTLKCFCIYDEILSKTVDFVISYDKCSFSIENEEDSTMTSILNFTYYFLVDVRANYIVSWYLLLKIWYFSQPNEKWIDHAFHNLTTTTVFLWNQEMSWYIITRNWIFVCTAFVLQDKFHPTKLHLYHGYSKLQFLLLFVKNWAICFAINTFFLGFVFCINFGLLNYWREILRIILEVSYTLFWAFLIWIYTDTSVGVLYFITSNYQKKGRNIYEVILFAVFMFWGLFKLASIGLFFNAVVLLVEYYYHIPFASSVQIKLIQLTAFALFLGCPKMIRGKKYRKWLWSTDLLSLCFSLYILKCIFTFIF